MNKNINDDLSRDQNIQEPPFFEWMFFFENKNLQGHFFAMEDMKDIIYILFYDKINATLIYDQDKDFV